MVITDRYDHAIDDKNRLAIPSQVRKALDATSDGSAFYLVPEGRYLQLIPEKLFERLTLSTSVATAGLTLAPEIAKARRLLFAGTARLEWDKQGRCIIPDRYFKDRREEDPCLEGILGREVTLVGVGDRLELWNRVDFQNHLRELMADRPAVQAAGAKAMASAMTGAGTSPQG